MANELKSLVCNRYSCRKFTDKAVKSSDLVNIMEVVRFCPSACNLQPYHFYAVSGSSFEKIKDMRSWYGAQTIIVCCVSNSTGWVRSTDKLCLNLCDLGIAIHPLMLEANNLGLATCVIGSFNPDELSKKLGLKEDDIPVIAIAIGYPDKADKPGLQHTLRKNIDEIFTVLE